MLQCFDLFYRVNNSSCEAELAAAETIATQCTVTIETQCIVNASLLQTIPDLQTLSRDSLSNVTVFPHNIPSANKLDSFKLRQEWLQ